MNALRLLRTRGWIVLLSALAVIGVALAVRELKPPGYTAEAVLVVPANSGAVNPGSADQAVRLAKTYRRLIPQNRELLRSVADRLSISSEDVRGAVAVRRRADNALLEISFTAHDMRRAITGANAFGDLSARGAPGIPAQGITVVSQARTATRVKSSDDRASYRASTIVLVSSGSGGPGPGNADQANKLATTFAGLIPDDQQVLRAIGPKLGRSTVDVNKRLTVINDTGTSLLRIRYKGEDPKEARTGARLTAEAVAGVSPVAGAIPPRALQLVRLPAEVSSVYTLGILLGVAGILGIALGLVLLVILERADPRVADQRSAARLLQGPVIAARRLTPDSADVLTRDWWHAALRTGRVTDDHAPSVVLVPVTETAAAAASDLATRLSHPAATDAAGGGDDVHAGRSATRAAGGSSGNVKVAERERPTSLAQSGRLGEGTVQVVAVGREERDPDLKHDLGLDLTAIVRHHLIVLVIPRDTRARQVAATVDLLAEAGRVADSAILTGRETSELPPG